MKIVSFILLYSFLFGCAYRSPESKQVSAETNLCKESDRYQYMDFSGPGWNLEQKKPYELHESYLVHTTVLTLRKSAKAQKRFRELTAAIAKRLNQHDGLIGFTVSGSIRCRTARTLGIWRDLASMQSFVASKEHMQAMLEFDKVAESGSVTHWNASAEEIPPSWNEAIKRLEQVESVNPVY